MTTSLIAATAAHAGHVRLTTDRLRAAAWAQGDQSGKVAAVAASSTTFERMMAAARLAPTLCTLSSSALV